MSSGEVVPVDGRRARRDRNRDAVLDAVHELFVEDRALPTVESVAERAGVSLRSVYRYFPDTRELMTAALARRVAQADSLFELPGLGEGSFEERLDRFVAQRLDVYERAAPTIRAALALAPNAPAVAEQVEARKAHLRAQAAEHFAPELAGRTDEQAESVLAAVEVLCQFEALELLRDERGMTVEAARRVLLAAMRAVLTSRRGG